uniref:ULP_PROTEASE domain-containing protein n=1 Tax=Syphacia muris TaxID=451379 RepID=A0A158R4S9_9BILA
MKSRRKIHRRKRRCLSMGVNALVPHNLEDSKPMSDSENCHEIDVYILSLETTVLRIRFPSRSMNIHISDFLCLREGALLNDIIIDFYINHIAAHLLPDDSVLKLHLFPALFWCHMKESQAKTLALCSKSDLNGGSNIDGKDKSLSENDRICQLEYWLDEENIFDADFLILPINHKQHWSLVVVCSPFLSLSCNLPDQNGQDLPLKPVVIIFDSQQPVEVSLKSLIITELDRFFELAFTKQSSNYSGYCFKNGSFKCIMPKNLPQQKNNVDCGVYILEYARRFLLSPPSIECLQSGDFDFSLLYPDFDVSGKRCEIQRTVLSLCSDYDIWRNLLNTVDVPFKYENHVVRIER